MPNQWYSFKGQVKYKDDGWVIITAPMSVANYYRTVIERLTWKKATTSLHFPHVTLVSGKHFKGLKNHPNWAKHQNEIVEVSYNNTIWSNDFVDRDKDGKEYKASYFWVRVDCPLIYKIREELGLPREHKKLPHLTICFMRK
jgi:hypothetical protein